MKYAEGLQIEREIVEPLFEGELSKEGIGVFRERRKPGFSR